MEKVKKRPECSTVPKNRYLQIRITILLSKDGRRCYNYNKYRVVSSGKTGKTDEKQLTQIMEGTQWAS